MRSHWQCSLTKFYIGESKTFNSIFVWILDCWIFTLEDRNPSRNSGPSPRGDSSRLATRNLIRTQVIGFWGCVLKFFLMYQFLCVLEVRSGYGEASARDYGGTWLDTQYKPCWILRSKSSWKVQAVWIVCEVHQSPFWQLPDHTSFKSGSQRRQWADDLPLLLFFVSSGEEIIQNLIHGFKPYDIMDNLDNVQSAITMRQLLALFLACRNTFKGSMIWKRAKPIKVHDITFCQGLGAPVISVFIGGAFIPVQMTCQHLAICFLFHSSLWLPCIEYVTLKALN